MEVFVVPVGPARHELYCDDAASAAAANVHAGGDATAGTDAAAEAPGWVARLKGRFSDMLREAERRRHLSADERVAPEGWVDRLQERLMAWVAERIAEQRLLWSLRHATEAVLQYPDDLTEAAALAYLRETLRGDRDRHRRWLVVHSVLFALSGILFFVPGPNVVAYYFAFRLVGHWLSMRGASQGLDRVAWTSRACAPLSAVRAAVQAAPSIREARLAELSAQLGLPQLPAFIDRVSPHGS